MYRKLQTGSIYLHNTPDNVYAISKVAKGVYVFAPAIGAMQVFDSYAALAQFMECAKGVPMQGAAWLKSPLRTEQRATRTR